MRHRLGRVAPVVLGAMLLASLTASGAAAQGSSGSRWDLLRAAMATARFHSADEATRAGFGPFPPGVPLHECISSFDNSGAMGFHWLNGGNLTTDLNPIKPQVLVYEPDRTGRLHLVALEYVVFKADWVAAHGDTVPELFGEMFMDSGFPNRYDIPQFYALHVWLWKFNPAGLFAPFNRNVSCAGATGSVGASTAATRGAVADRVATTAATAGFVCSMRRAASA